MRQRYGTSFLLWLGCRSSGSRLKQFRWHYLGLVLFLFAVNSVLQPAPLVFDGDFSRTRLSDFNVGAAHRVGCSLGNDLIDHIVVGERQVL